MSDATIPEIGPEIIDDVRARVQGLNDFLVMGMVTLASFSSGVLMSHQGWQAVNLAPSRSCCWPRPR